MRICLRPMVRSDCAMGLAMPISAPRLARMSASVEWAYGLGINAIFTLNPHGWSAAFDRSRLVGSCQGFSREQKAAFRIGGNPDAAGGSAGLRRLNGSRRHGPRQRMYFGAHHEDPCGR